MPEWANTIAIILSPSPAVTLSEEKGLGLGSELKIDSTESIIEILRLTPQNDIAKQSFSEGGCEDLAIEIEP